MFKQKRTLFILLGVLLIACCGLTAVSCGSADSNGIAAVSSPAPSDQDTTEAVDSAEESQPDVPANAAADEEPAEPTHTPEPTDEPTATAEPTTAPTATPQPSPTPPPQGLSRSNPLPLAEPAVAPNWTVQVLEVLRGDAAWQQVQAANQFNDPPADGNQYVLVKLAVENTSTEEEALQIGGSDFRMTGDRLIEYSSAFAAAPEPELDAELFTGGTAEGWVAFEVGADEGSLMLIVDELWNFDDDRYRFIALDDGAALQVDSTLDQIEPTDIGLSRAEPLSLGTTAVTNDWEITITEVRRGDDAWQLAESANMFNDLPADGMEYIAFFVTARQINTRDTAETIDSSFFRVTGSSNLLHDSPFVVEPEPQLDARLFPGGSYSGWVFEQAQSGETNLIAVFSPLFSFTDEDTRYLALEDGASVSIPADLGSTADEDTGSSRNTPAAVGEPVLTQDWELTLLEVVRGQAATDLALAANQFNDPPEPGMAYIAVRLAARSLHREEEARHISSSDFNVLGDAGVIYDAPAVVAPEPQLDFYHFPGGASEGWIVMEAPADETGLMLEFDPSLLGSPRYFALE